jgi:hypothetical protein
MYHKINFVGICVQLDDACHRRGGESGIGGSLLLLSVSMWERFPVGRPKNVSYDDWLDDVKSDPQSGTWTYKWDVVSEFKSDPQRMYLQYINEFVDTLTIDQVLIDTSRLFNCLLEITELIVFFFVTGALGAIRIWGQFWDNLWAVAIEPEVHASISSLASSCPILFFLRLSGIYLLCGQ